MKNSSKIIFLLVNAISIIAFVMLLQKEPLHLPEEQKETTQLLYTDQDKNCLTSAIYYEAGNQSIEGKYAVAEVIKNRLESPKFKGESYCAIIKEHKQFSFLGEGKQIVSTEHKHKNKEEQLAFEESKKVAEKVMLQKENKILPKTVLYYHATYVKPYWLKTKVKVAKIGSHIFYAPKPKSQTRCTTTNKKDCYNA